MKHPITLLLLFALFASFQSDKSFVSDNEHLTMAVLYQQHAPEYAALCYQAYNLATARLQAQMRRKSEDEKLAVILDLDETVLDNSPYEAKLILDNISYPNQWEQWCNLAAATAVPGAVEFIRRAGELGVDVFFITNRREELREMTRKNLVAIGLPDVTEEQLLMRVDDPAKELRRTQVAQTHKIVLMIGDNLNDFSVLFEQVSGDQRLQQAHRLNASFGDMFIVLPNAMYGNWIQDLYPETDNTSVLKRAARYRKLKGF